MFVYTGAEGVITLPYFCLILTCFTFKNMIDDHSGGSGGVVIVAVAVY